MGRGGRPAGPRGIALHPPLGSERALWSACSSAPLLTVAAQAYIVRGLAETTSSLGPKTAREGAKTAEEGHEGLRRLHHRRPRQPQDCPNEVPKSSSNSETKRYHAWRPYSSSPS
eukprot:8321960-Pyramimonas_sp.AAC.1